MAKDFKKINNPAMQFITTEDNAAEDTVSNTDNTNNADHMNNMDNMDNMSHMDNTDDMNDTDNADNKPNNKLTGRCFNLVFSSTDTLKDLRALAFMQKTKSLNAFINKIVAEYIEAHADDIRKYNDFFN